MGVGRCDRTFCRRHRARTLGDPAGSSNSGASQALTGLGRLLHNLPISIPMPPAALPTNAGIFHLSVTIAFNWPALGAKEATHGVERGHID
jgi:hypothetical protein